MKNLGIKCALTVFGLSASCVYADTVLGGYIGVNAWNMEVDGGFANEESVTDFAFEDKTQASFYAALEHPIPLIPNIKLMRTPMDTAGVVSLTSEFRFGDELYTSQTDLMTDLELTSTDYILYYEILDNDLISVDLGINGKHLDGVIMVSELDGDRSTSESFSGIVPMVYSKVEIGIPATGISAYVEGSYLSLDDNTLSDFQAAVAYSFVESLAIDMSIEAGFRSTNLELDDVDDIYTDLEFSGVYVGLEFDF
jgi:outer membrane protein